MANGMIERGHQPIVDALSKLTGGKPGMWPQHLHAVLWADRTTVRDSTGIAPFRLLYERDAVLPIEIEYPTWHMMD